MCRLTSSNDTVFEDLNVIETYTVDTQWNKNICDKVKRICRNDCDAKLKKLMDNQSGHLQKLHKHTQPYGSLLCKKYGEKTSNGGVRISSRFMVSGCGRQWKIGRWMTDLCCGDTTVVKNNQVQVVFAWNSDCKAITYHPVH